VRCPQRSSRRAGTSRRRTTTRSPAGCGFFSRLTLKLRALMMPSLNGRVGRHRCGEATAHGNRGAHGHGRLVEAEQPLASRAAMICWVISSRVIQPSSARRLRFASRSVGAELESRLSLHSGDRFLVASSSSTAVSLGMRCHGGRGHLARPRVATYDTLLTKTCNNWPLNRRPRSADPRLVYRLSSMMTVPGTHVSTPAPAC